VVVFQDPTLFPWRTVWNNVALGLEAQGILKSQRHRVDAAIDLVGLSEFRNAYPHQLSGGMAHAGRAGAGAGQRSQNPYP
jgi:NitT/TauT family transport system ATP-binding protein